MHSSKKCSVRKMKPSDTYLFPDNIGSEHIALTANMNNDEKIDLKDDHPNKAHLEGGKEADKTRHPFGCDKLSISDMCLAVAQANLVHQTQQDIMRMFSLDFCEHSENKEVEQNCQDAKECVSIKEHYTPVTGQYTCEICERSFTSPGYLKKHKIVHDNENSLTCHYGGCRRKFSTPSHLKYHLLTHQNARQYKCTTDGCLKSFLTPQQLGVHTRTHTGERPFKCDKCQKAFSTAGNLKNHIRTHTGDKPFECTECNLRFAEQSSLKKHSLVHTGEKPHKCPICKRPFTQVGSMRVHMRKHDTEGKVKETNFTTDCVDDGNTGTKVLLHSENSDLETKQQKLLFMNPSQSTLLFIIPHVQLLETNNTTGCEELNTLTEPEFVNGGEFLYADHEEIVCDTPFHEDLDGD